MTAFHSNDYLERMIPWLNVLPKFLSVRTQTAPGTEPEKAPTGPCRAI